jgi:transposase
MDKGMNAEAMFSWIDSHEKIHFITTYSPYFREDLCNVSLTRFTTVDTEKNRRLIAENKEDDCIVAYRTKAEYWGKERTVVVTFNPTTSRKKTYTLTSNLGKIRQELLEMREKVRNNAPHWRDPDVIKTRYIRLCHRLHVPSTLYVLNFDQSTTNNLTMTFHKDHYRVNQKRNAFGRNIIITDQQNWATHDIIQANIDRWQIEERFKISKDENLVGTRPVRHWTDSKINCHFFTCVVAITYMRRLELKLQKAGINRTATDVMDEMKHFHSILSIGHPSNKPNRRLETPSPTQSAIFKSLGYQVNSKGVLRPISA